MVGGVTVEKQMFLKTEVLESDLIIKCILTLLEWLVTVRRPSNFGQRSTAKTGANKSAINRVRRLKRFVHGTNIRRKFRNGDTDSLHSANKLLQVCISLWSYLVTDNFYATSVKWNAVGRGDTSTPVDGGGEQGTLYEMQLQVVRAEEQK